MSAAEPTTLILEEGVLTFDGQVVETFGFVYDQSMRAHVATIEQIKLDEGGRFTSPSVTFNCGGRPLIASFTKEESPRVVALAEAVRAVAPRLQGTVG